jgi:fatty-acyl-CoA synthase
VTFLKFGLAAGMISSITNGNKVVFPNFFPDTLSTIKSIHNEKCTSLKGAPVIFVDLLNHPELKSYNLSSLEAILLGASTVPKDLLLKIKEKLNLQHVIIG